MRGWCQHACWRCRRHHDHRRSHAGFDTVEWRGVGTTKTPARSSAEYVTPSIKQIVAVGIFCSMRRSPDGKFPSPYFRTFVDFHGRYFRLLMVFLLRKLDTMHASRDRQFVVDRRVHRLTLECSERQVDRHREIPGQCVTWDLRRALQIPLDLLHPLR